MIVGTAFSALQTHFGLGLCGLNRGLPQVAHPHQIVGRQCEGKHPADSSGPPMPSLTQAADSLEPAEDFFYPFAFLLANRVARMTSGALIDNAGGLARNMWSYLVVAQLIYLSADDPEKEIQIYVNSAGGAVTAGFAIYDTMQYVRSPISTVCIGRAASFGTVILMAGAKGRRFSLPNATIHMHQPLIGGRRPAGPGQRPRHPRARDPAHQGRPQRAHRQAHGSAARASRARHGPRLLPEP